MGLDPTTERPDPSTPAGNRPWEDVPRGMKLVAGFFVLNFAVLLLGSGEFLSIGGSVATILGTAMLVVSLVGLVSAYGLVMAKPWGYLGTFVVGSLMLALSVLTLQVVRSGLLGFILYYVYNNGDPYRPD